MPARIKKRPAPPRFPLERVFCFFGTFVYLIMMISFASEAFYEYKAFKQDEWAFSEDASGVIYLLALTAMCSFSLTICGAFGSISMKDKSRLYAMLVLHPVIAILIVATHMIYSKLPDGIDVTAPWHAAIPSVILSFICLLILLIQAKLRIDKRRNTQ